MFKKLSYALNGIKVTYVTQSSFRLLLLSSIISWALGLLLKVETSEMVVLFLCGFLVLSAEIVNTTIERVFDVFTQGWLLDEVGVIKDLSAGAVLVLSVMSLVVDSMILIPHLLSRLSH